MVKHIRARALDAVERMSPLVAVICVALLVAPLLPPSPSILYNWHEGVLVAPFRIWRYISIAVILVSFVLIGKIKDPFAGGIFLLAVLAFFSTWICDGSKRDCVNDWSGYVAAVLLVASLCKVRTKELLQGILATVVLMSLANVASVLLFPEGVYELAVYFYGNRNIAYQLSFLVIACAIVLDVGNGGKMEVLAFVFVAIALFQILLVRSVTSCIAALFLCVVLVAVRWHGAREALSGITMFVGSVVLFVLVVVCRITNLFAPLVTGVLGKSLSLSGRTYIWDLMFHLFEGWHIWFGYGFSGNSLIYVNGGHYNHAHNMYLDAWFLGGVLLLLVFAVLLFAASMRLYRTRNWAVSGVLSAVFGAYLIVGITEPMTRVSFFIILALCFYLPERCLLSKPSRKLKSA